MLDITTFLKAQGSAVVCTVVDFTLTAFLVSVVGVYYVGAVATGAVAGGMLNFSVNRTMVFRDAYKTGLLVVGGRYAMVWIGSILLNTIGTFAMTESTHMNCILSKAVVAIVVAVCWNYLMQRHFVFRKINR